MQFQRIDTLILATPLRLFRQNRSKAHLAALSRLPSVWSASASSHALRPA